jgi:DNA-binding transcriptional LysR family regulator
LRSFTAAGRELGLTQAAVSQQIRLLEATLQVPLFVRLRRGVELTPDGAAYLPHIQAAFRLIAQNTAELFGGRTQRRTVRLRCPISFAALWMAPRLPAFFADCPDTRLEIVTAHAPADYEIEPDGLDVRFGMGAFPGRTSYRLTWERLVPASAPMLKQTHQNWTEWPLLAIVGARELWSDWFAAAGVVPIQKPVLRCDSFILAFEAARAGAGVLLASRPLADLALARGDLVTLSPIELAGNAGHFITHPAGASLSANEQRVMKWWVERQNTPQGQA